MADSRKPRKRYVPRATAINTIDIAITRASLVDEPRRERLMGPVRAALHAAREGRLTAQRWCDLVDAANVGYELALRNIASDRVEQFLGAMRVLADIAERVEIRRCWTLYGHEITALADLVELHDVQLKVCSKGELVAAIGASRRRVQQGQRGNHAPAARVVNAPSSHARGAAA